MNDVLLSQFELWIENTIDVVYSENHLTFLRRLTDD